MIEKINLLPIAQHFFKPEVAPLVTICSTTHNREKYIGEAIESWMMQKTNFPVSIIISDNCSTDNTVGVIRVYMEKYPGRITLQTSDRDRGMMVNFFGVLKSANGKYVANCDGDDYWTDEYKLQKQADFLEANPDFSCVYTNSIILDEDTGETKTAKLHIWNTANTESLLDHNDFINDNLQLSPGHISSIFYRNFLINKFPDWLYGCYLNDFPLFLMLSKFGRAKFINELATVYRVHSLGVSSNNFSYVNTYMDRIHAYKGINTFFDNAYSHKINPLISRHYYNIGKHLLQRKTYMGAAGALGRALYYGKGKIPRLDSLVGGVKYDL